MSKMVMFTQAAKPAKIFRPNFAFFIMISNLSVRGVLRDPEKLMRDAKIFAHIGRSVVLGMPRKPDSPPDTLDFTNTPYTHMVS